MHLYFLQVSVEIAHYFNDFTANHINFEWHIYTGTYTGVWCVLQKGLKAAAALSGKNTIVIGKKYFIAWGVFNVFMKRMLRDFYAPGLKGPPGASSNWIVRLSVCLSVCPSVCLSVIPSRLQTKCNILSLGDDKVTKLGL